MEFKSLRNIESSFKQIRLFGIVFLAVCAAVAGYSVWSSYRFAEAQREKIYVLDEGKSLMLALSQDMSQNRPVEAREHIKRFHELFFTLSPDRSAIEGNITRALFLVDKSAFAYYEDMQEKGYYEQRSNRVNMFDTLDIYVNEKRGKVSPDQIKDYNTLKKHLANFKAHSSQPVTFRNLNLKFYNEFMDYLYYKAEKPDGTIGLLTNSAGKVVRLLKGFVNYQVAKGVIPAVDLTHFKVVEEETDAIYLNEAELAAIYRLDLSDDTELAEIRDVFIVGCFTGLRYSDLSTLSLEHIDVIGGNINLKQRKVHKAVVVPMIDYVPEILKKYDYDLPKIPSYTFNERVKELGRRAKLRQKIEVVRKKGTLRVKEVREKWEMISSHTCRRSFCTNMYLSGFPAEELMRISGHKSPAAFMRYIKVDNMQAANRLRALRDGMKK